jgi:hypothetical protein
MFNRLKCANGHEWTYHLPNDDGTIGGIRPCQAPGCESFVIFRCRAIPSGTLAGSPDGLVPAVPDGDLGQHEPRELRGVLELDKRPEIDL